MAKDLRYRFDEVITAVRLLPDDPDEVDGHIVLPNLTRDMAEPELYTAILCQTMKETDEDNFQIKMITALANSAIESMAEQVDDKPSEDDLMAISVAANIAWACGSVDTLFQLTGLLGKVVAHFDIEMPDLATAFLKGNKGADRFGELDPYKILNHEYTPAEIVEHALDGHKPDSTMEQILKLLNEVADIRKDMDKKD